jgi:ketosteroid isomerase-like protein
MNFVSSACCVFALTLSSVAFAQTASSASGTALSPLAQQILAKEKEGLDALKAGNIAAFGDLTADDAVLVDDHGPADKAQVMKNVAGFQLTDYTISGVHFVQLSSSSGLVSYDMVETGASHGHTFSAHVFVSSIWAQRAGKWLCLFSQETAARPAH